MPSTEEQLRNLVTGLGREDRGFWLFLARYADAEGRLPALARVFPERAALFATCREAAPREAAAGNPQDHDFSVRFRTLLLALD